MGTKISLSAVNRLAPDQLAPFLGLYNFVRDLDHYKGTIFRFPLRAVGAKTLLKDHAQHVDRVEVRSLLGEYLGVARTALLFLRSVESIEFRIRDQEDPQWSVTARRSQRQDSDTCQDVEITSIQGGRLQQIDRWCVGRRDITQIPANVFRFGRGSEKSAECGIAICLTSQKTDAEEDTVMAGQPLDVVSGSIQTVDHKVYCRLPTGHTSSLPVSFHASFAVTGDRRSIALEDTADNSAWNKWLLTVPVANLYLEVLQHLTTSLGEKVFDFWPSMASYHTSPTLSETLCRAFWNSLLIRGQSLDSLFPLVAQDYTSKYQDGPSGDDVSKAAVSLAEARFDFLSSHVSLTLRPLLVKLCPTLVRLPQSLWPDYKRTAVEKAWLSKEIESDYLCQVLFNDDNCKVLEAFIRSLKQKEEKRAAISMLLEMMVPKITGTDMTPLDILGGCRVLPRPNLDAPLGLLLRNAPPSSTCHYVATAEAQDLFAFASDSMVNTELFQDANDLIDMLTKASFNIQRLRFSDLGQLLARSRSPTDLSIAFDNRDAWIARFWRFINPKLRAQFSTPFSVVTFDTLLTKCGLCDRAVYRFRSNSQWCYLTPREFEAQPCVIEPLDSHQRKLCEQIAGLRVIDRECVPSLLSESEDDLNRHASFRRLVQAFEKIERTTQTPTKMLVGKILNSNSKEILQTLLLNHLDIGEASNVSLLRSLPVWRRLRTSDSGLSVEHIAAEDAKFCGHSGMLLPWVHNLASFVRPKLVNPNRRALSKLHITPLTAQQTWGIIEVDLPTNVKVEVSRKQYLGMIQYLAANGVKVTEEKVAPNGASVLCEVRSLYDHRDNIFKAAFRDQEKIRFLHIDFRVTSLNTFWLSAGLRARPPTGAMMSEHFLECALAINRRWDPAHTSQSFEEDAGIVAAYLQFDRPEFRNWSNWAQISKIQMFRVRNISPNENSYRLSCMHRGKTHCALEEASSLDHIRIVWSQTKFLQDPPCPYVFQRLPRGGVPSAAIVYQHLRVLMNIIEDVTQYDLAEYLRDVQACYEHLQNELEATQFIPGVHQAGIWLNLDTTQVDLISKDDVQGPTSAQLLCLNCPGKQSAVRRRMGPPFTTPSDHPSRRATGHHTIPDDRLRLHGRIPLARIAGP